MAARRRGEEVRVMDRRDWIPLGVVLLLLALYIAWGLSDPNEAGQAALSIPAELAQ